MNNERRTMLLKAVAIGAVAVLALDHLVVTPFMNSWKERSDRMTTLSRQIQKGEQLLSREVSLNQKWKEMLASDLPEDLSSAENLAFKALSVWARQSGVIYGSLTPQWKKFDEGYQTLECRATVSGDQESIGRLLYEMEKDKLAVRLEDCEINTRDSKGEKLTANLRFSFIRLGKVKGARS